MAGKVALGFLPPATVAFWRFAIGAVVLVPLWLGREGIGSLPRGGRAWGGVAALALLGVAGYNWLFFKGLARVEPGVAALVVTTNPALTAAVSALVLGERMSAARWAGFGLAASGALVVLSGGDVRRALSLHLGPGAGLLGLAVLSWVAYVVLSRVLVARLSPLAVTALSFLLGLPVLAVAAAAEAPLGTAAAAPWRAWGALGFLGVFSSALGFAWFAEGVKVFGAARASVFIYLVPGFALLLSHLVLAEPVTAPKLGGGALVVLGVALANRSCRRAPAA